MIAILLAAGLGTRLYPLTLDRPKALLDVAGRPVLDRVLDALRDVPDLERVVIRVSTRFAPLFEAWRTDFRFPVAIDLHENGIEEPDRAHGALRDLALTWETLPRDRNAFVLSADNVPRFSLAFLARELVRTGEPLLLYRESSGPVPPRRHGIVEVDERGRVTSFEEKPARPRTNRIACSHYAFPPSVRERLRDYLEAGGNEDAPGHFLAWLVDRVPVRALPCPGELLDTGSVDGLERARCLLGDDRPPGSENS